MSDLDLAYTPATKIVRQIKAKEISPVTVIENALRRIDEVNAKLNCFCFVYPEEALENARRAEQAVMAGDALGPLHGIPIAIKDLTATKGKRTTLGSYVYRDWVPDFDAIVVERLIGAGAILVGKTATPEFAHAGYTESPLWGVTRNPWDLTRTPGGSSGGSGAAVASGCVPLAEGTDMGGSVRIPAADCGIVGLKPSLGRIPMDILPSVFDNISHFGPLARTVSDAALFLKVAHGPDDRDIQSQVAPLDMEIPVSADIKGLKLAFSPDLGFHTIDSEVAVNSLEAVEAMRDAGAEIEEIELDWDPEVETTWHKTWTVFMAGYFGHHLEQWREKMDPAVVALMEQGFKISAADYKRLEMLRSEQWKQLAEILKRYDALLTPTMAAPPPTIEQCRRSPIVDSEGRYVMRFMTMAFNLVGQCPVLSVPSGFTAAGLPTALSICGRRFDDFGVLRIGAGLEAVRPWSHRRPSIQ